MSWGSFPQAFVDGNGLVRLLQSAGKHRLGALKVYLALTMQVDFKSRSVSLGLRGLQHLTGMSRPIVVRSIDELERARICTVDRTGYRNVFTLVDRVPDDKQFAKVPKNSLTKALKRLPNRGESGDAALSLYLVLLARRMAFSSTTITISHDRLRSLCSLRNEFVRPGLDVLINHRLIHVDQGIPMMKGEVGHPSNLYRLIGDFGDLKPKQEQSSAVKPKRKRKDKSRDIPF